MNSGKYLAVGVVALALSGGAATGAQQAKTQAAAAQGDEALIASMAAALKKDPSVMQSASWKSLPQSMRDEITQRALGLKPAAPAPAKPVAKAKPCVTKKQPWWKRAARNAEQNTLTSEAAKLSGKANQKTNGNVNNVPAPQLPSGDTGCAK
jgi:hypothetical protein